MRPQLIRYSGSLLGIAILALVILGRNSMILVLPGLPYLMAADLLSLMCVVSAKRLRAQNSRAASMGGETIAHRKALMLLLVALQMVVIGLANIPLGEIVARPVNLLFDYSGVVIFFVASYRLLSLADSPKQHGGYKPFSFIGYPRSRRFLFVVFAGYCTLAPLTLASLEFSVGSGGWRPAAFQSSQACLLISAIMSLLCAGLISQRYRGLPGPDKKAHLKAFFAAVLLIAVAGGIRYLLTRGIYVTVLSAVAIIGISLSGCDLWQASDDSDDNAETVQARSIGVL